MTSRLEELRRRIGVAESFEIERQEQEAMGPPRVESLRERLRAVERTDTEQPTPSIEEIEAEGPTVSQRIGQFAAEATPATVGAAVGGGLGAVSGLGPIGIIGLGSLGGAAGEFLGQQMGVNEPDTTAVAMAAGGPLAGRVMGGAARLGRRLIGAAATMPPPVKSGLARRAAREASGDFEALGSRILREQQGLMSVPATDLYDRAKALGAVVPRENVQRTADALFKLTEEMGNFRHFPEGRQAIQMVRAVSDSLSRGESVSFNDVVLARELVGAAVGKLQGHRLGQTKQVFKALSEDIDAIAQMRGRPGQAARVVQAASQRAKLEFAVRDLENRVAMHMRLVPGQDGAELNVKALRKWFGNATNPKSNSFDKNFTDALGPRVKEISERLKVLDKATEAVGSAAGPGSIVVRGITAGGGMYLGNLAFGAPGAGLGALAGARAPEAMSAIVLHPQAGRVFERAARLGKGEVNPHTWNIIGELLAQSMIERPKTGEPQRPPAMEPGTLGAP